jgi:GTP pyrophosphokinase
MRHSRRIESSGDARLEELVQHLSLSTDPEEQDRLRHALAHALEVEDDDETRPRSRDVAEILHGLGVDQDTLVATLLSDPRLRDSLDEATIAEQFGDTVAQLVKNVHWLNTFKECSEETVQAPEQAERLRRMLLAMVDDVRAVLIKLAYRVQRLRVLPKSGYDVRRCVARETLEIYAPLANRLGVGQLKWELEDLAFRYLEPQVYKQVAKSLEENRLARETYIEDLVARLRKAFAEEGIEAEVYGRPKHIHSIWRKMQRKQVPIQELYDLRAVRIMVDKIANCYAALGVVHGLWPHVPSEFDDYIAHPKDNGYQSLHTAVIGPDGKTVEIQIRTRAMHEFAELGVAAHWRYKEGGRHDTAMERAIGSLRRLLDHGDDDVELLEDFRSDLFPDRVFVMSPKGQVLDLPRGATPLDFAYTIHTEVGHRCRGAKVNGRIVPLTYELKTGEQVEILTAKEGAPARDWMNPNMGFLKTSSARGKVRHWFKQQDHERNLADGRATLEREAKRLGVHAVDMDEVAKHFKLSRSEDLLIGIGRGDITPAQLAGALRVPEIPTEIKPTRHARRPKKSKGEKGDEIKIHGVGNLLVQFAKCCHPLPGDPIVGFITRGKGVTVHRQDCANVLNLSRDEHGRLIEVGWGDEAEAHPVEILVEAYDRQGLLRDITSVLANEKVNVLAANTRTDKLDQSVTMQLTVEVTDTAQLGVVLDKLSQVQNVAEVQRRG